MRTITHIVLHCTATPPNTTIESIKRYWREDLGWVNPGYHYMIKANGEIVNTHPINQVANGVYGHNQHSIHIAYIGGVDVAGQPIDNRTAAQRNAQLYLLCKLSKQFKNAEILGHRDFPGVTKACPSFDVKTWLKKLKF